MLTAGSAPGWVDHELSGSNTDAETLCKQTHKRSLSLSAGLVARLIAGAVQLLAFYTPNEMENLE